MQITRFAALAAMLLGSASALAADSPTGNTYAVRQIDLGKGIESFQDGATRAVARDPEAASPVVENCNDLGILERHFLLRAGIAC